MIPPIFTAIVVEISPFHQQPHWWCKRPVLDSYVNHLLSASPHLVYNRFPRPMKRIPRIIPPRSRVRLVRADRTTREWQSEIGRQFRVGYYSRRDGLDCIWLVNEKGEYEQTTDRDGILRYFAIEKLADERDYYGVHKRTLGLLRKKQGRRAPT